MDATVIIIDEDPGRKDRTAQFLAWMSLNVRTFDSLSSFLSGMDRTDPPAVAVIGLTRLTAARTDLLRRVRKTFPAASLIALIRTEDADAGITFLRQNLVDQVASPDNWGNLYSAVKTETERKKLIRENEAAAQQLDQLKKEKSLNADKAAELEEIYTATLENLTIALDLRDVETFGHSVTVAKYCQALARLLGITDDAALDNIRRGALLHDIGKIAIPDAILKKPGPLSPAEWEKIKLHPVLGYGLIKEIKLVEEVGNVILYHHERYDGKGYPKGLKGEAIPLEARMFALADALDAITSHRPYREKRDFATARTEIENNRKGQFDPVVVDAFCSIPLEGWEKIRYETTKLIPNMESFSALLTRRHD
ncbi:MAG: HD domain-containing protein [Candidatus Aminicenantes bacterium]|nr:HD domain-containing protein [Candidatus Aminicenantes bacterium]